MGGDVGVNGGRLGRSAIHFSISKVRDRGGNPVRKGEVKKEKTGQRTGPRCPIAKGKGRPPKIRP